MMPFAAMRMKNPSGGGGGGGTNWRYWRINVSANNGDTYLAMQEVELRGSIGGADLTTTGMTVTESSYYAPGGNTGAKAFDNDFSNYINNSWVANAAFGWVAIDLGSAMSVAEVAIWPQNYGGGTNRGAMDFKVQGSSDGSSWTDVQTFTGVTGWSAGTAKTFTL